MVTTHKSPMFGNPQIFRLLLGTMIFRFSQTPQKGPPRHAVDGEGKAKDHQEDNTEAKDDLPPVAPTKIPPVNLPSLLGHGAFQRWLMSG